MALALVKLPVDLRHLATQLSRLYKRPVCLKGGSILEVFNVTLLESEFLQLDDFTIKIRDLEYRFPTVKMLNEILAKYQPKRVYDETKQELVESTKTELETRVKGEDSDSDSTDSSILSDGWDSDDSLDEKIEADVELDEIKKEFPSIIINNQ